MLLCDFQTVIFFSKNPFETRKKKIFYRQFDTLYNLGESKNNIGDKSGSLEDWFSRKPVYKGLRGFLMTIFGISMTVGFVKNAIDQLKRFPRELESMFDV